jgi:7-alpha-hydroxysteroid dehydrogenase
VFRLCQVCAPHIEAAGGGAILNISSMAGDKPSLSVIKQAIKHSILCST